MQPYQGVGDDAAAYIFDTGRILSTGSPPPILPVRSFWASQIGEDATTHTEFTLGRVQIIDHGQPGRGIIMCAD